MGCCVCFLLYAIIPVILGFLFLRRRKSSPVPTIEEKWWALGTPTEEDTSVKPFKIEASDEVIKDLHRRIDNAIPFQQPLEGVNHNYGINTNLLKAIVDYWRNQYDWSKRQEFLNQFPHFKTSIQGLNIHFIHAKPKDVPEGVQVVPILLVHGWPGSVREFYEMIPILTTPQTGRNFVFEVVAPSLPGYGFSDAASKPGMNPAQIAQIFNKLMGRLGFDRYYIQGGDWGSGICHDLAVLYPNSIIGVHRNLHFGNGFTHWKVLLGIYFPSLFFTEKEIQKIYPLKKNFFGLLLESGYFHIQTTKPDTVGVGLRDSPVGLAAYIIEKFITWTNPAWKDLPDGGLTQRYTYDKLLDNVMIYWITRSITTSMRLYAETYSQPYRDLNIGSKPITVPSGLSRFEHEISFPPETILKEDHKNFIHLTDRDGGHFAAFEVPDVLGKDILDFVEKVRSTGLDSR